MSHEINNDLKKVELMMEMFNQIRRLNFQTETGQKFKQVITVTLDETIIPYARDTYKCIKDGTNKEEVK